MNDIQNRHCPNCGAEVHGEYCHRCGQKQDEYVSSLKHILHQFLEDYFTFDSRLFRSIGPLFFKPGRLVNEYLGGKRQRFIRPLRMYLFASLIFFFILSVGGEVVIIGGGTEEQEDVAATTDSVMRTIRDSFRATSTDSATRARMESVFKALEDTAVARPDTGFGTIDVRRAEEDTTGETVNIRFRYGGEVHTYRLNQETFRRDFINNLPQMMFVLLPLFALVLKLLYIRRNRLYVEHLVFALYYHAFVFLLFSATTLLSVGFISTLGALLVVIYLFLALLRVYRQSVFKTLVKMVGLMVVYGVTLGVALAGNVILTIIL